jgi:hypothetical protein
VQSAVKVYSDGLTELKAVRADLGNWQRNLSAAEQDRLSLSASVGGLLQPRQAPPRGRTLADHPAVALPQGGQDSRL